MEWKPNRRGRHVYVVLRADSTSFEYNDVSELIVATTAYLDSESAEAEVQRLSNLNKTAKYFWVIARLLDEEVSDEIADEIASQADVDVGR